LHSTKEKPDTCVLVLMDAFRSSLSISILEHGPDGNLTWRVLVSYSTMSSWTDTCTMANMVCLMHARQVCLARPGDDDLMVVLVLLMTHLGFLNSTAVVETLASINEQRGP
jgi:hypothetical protein